MVDLDTHTIVSYRDMVKSPVLAPCNICFLKTINYIEAQKYLFVINWPYLFLTR